MITVIITCPDHGDQTLDINGVILAPELGVVFADCPAGAHMFERAVSERAVDVLSNCGAATVESLA